jgi:hypothetical protein
LFENALFDEPHSDNQNIGAIKEMHRLGAVMQFKGEFLPVKITVKEYNDINEKNKVYSVEAIEIEKARKDIQLEFANDAETNSTSPTTIAGFNGKILKIIEAVNKLHSSLSLYTQHLFSQSRLKLTEIQGALLKFLSYLKLQCRRRLNSI